MAMLRAVAEKVRPRRLASGKGVDQKGAQPQATEVVSSVKPQACEVIEGAGGGI